MPCGRPTRQTATGCPLLNHENPAGRADRPGPAKVKHKSPPDTPRVDAWPPQTDSWSSAFSSKPSLLGFCVLLDRNDQDEPGFISGLSAGTSAAMISPGSMW